MNTAKDKTGLFRGHLHVARMAYRSADYRAALRNLNSAQYAIEQTGQKPDDIDMHEFKRLYGKVYLALKHLDQAETAFREAFELSSRGGFATARILISDNRHIADCVRLRGKLQEAETIYKQLHRTTRFRRRPKRPPAGKVLSGSSPSLYRCQTAGQSHSIN
jgi:tetratricopeptide (TPR) repeat protein